MRRHRGGGGAPLFRRPGVWSCGAPVGGLCSAQPPTARPTALRLACYASDRVLEPVCCPCTLVPRGELRCAKGQCRRSRCRRTPQLIVAGTLPHRGKCLYIGKSAARLGTGGSIPHTPPSIPPGLARPVSSAARVPSPGHGPTSVGHHRSEEVGRGESIVAGGQFREGRFVPRMWIEDEQAGEKLSGCSCGSACAGMRGSAPVWS